ncbi:MAG: hypothetical protein WC441_03955 [Patescibacteria group bacterium]
MKKLYLYVIVFCVLSAQFLVAQGVQQYNRSNVKWEYPYRGDSNICKIVLPYAKVSEVKHDTLIGDSLVTTYQQVTSYKIMLVRCSGEKIANWVYSYRMLDLILNPGQTIRCQLGPQRGETKRSGFLNLMKHRPYEFTASLATYSEKEKTLFSEFKDYSYEEVRFDYWLLIGAFFLSSLFSVLLCSALERLWPDVILNVAILFVFLVLTAGSPGISPIYLSALIGGIISGFISYYRSNKKKNKALVENLNVISEDDKQSLK